MNISKLQVKKTYLNDIINHKNFNEIQLPKYLEGNVGYVTFLNKNTLVANIENEKYFVGSKTVSLPTFYDINTIYVTNLLSHSSSPIISKVLTKSLTRMAHNLCLFQNRDKNGFYALGGRYDKQQPDRWKPFPITEDKGLYLAYKEKLDGQVWKIMNNKKPVIGKDPISKFRKPASYDSQISCIYCTFLKKYILAVRNNIGKEQRFFSILSSDDCLKWCNFETPLLNPPYFPESGDQYYSIILHEIPKLKIIMGSALFYNENSKLYGIKLLLTSDAKIWKDTGIIFNLPTDKMPRNGYIRPKIHCGGINSDDSGKITFFFYKYKQRNAIQYFQKSLYWKDLFNAV